MKKEQITSPGHLDLPNSTDASWNIAQVGISADKHLAAANRYCVSIFFSREQQIFSTMCPKKCLESFANILVHTHRPLLPYSCQ